MNTDRHRLKQKPVRRTSSRATSVSVLSEPKLTKVTKAEYVSGCPIRLSFNDGVVRVMDFEPFLKKARNRMITKYRQLRYFKKFHLHCGDLMWGDFDMIFPITDLHRGEI